MQNVSRTRVFMQFFATVMMNTYGIFLYNASSYPNSEIKLWIRAPRICLIRVYGIPAFGLSKAVHLFFDTIILIGKQTIYESKDFSFPKPTLTVFFSFLLKQYKRSEIPRISLEYTEWHLNYLKDFNHQNYRPRLLTNAHIS